MVQSSNAVSVKYDSHQLVSRKGAALGDREATKLLQPLRLERQNWELESC